MRNFDVFVKHRLKASEDFINGEVGSLIDISVNKAPATIFGPSGNIVQGIDAVNSINGENAKLFKGGMNKFEILHQVANDNIAYLVGVQRSTVIIDGQDQELVMNLRVTEIFRVEDDEWKLFHRHADFLKIDESV